MDTVGMIIVDNAIGREVTDMMYIVDNIRWDLDEGDNAELPQQIFIWCNELGDEVECALSDKITDITGYCHNGFQYKMIGGA